MASVPPDERDEIVWYLHEYQIAGGGSAYTVIGGGSKALGAALQMVEGSMRRYAAGARIVRHGPYGSMEAAWGRLPAGCVTMGAP